MEIIGIPFLQLLHMVIHLYTWVVIASVLMNWLTIFGLVNPHNRFVAFIGDILSRLTQPVLDPLRRILPELGGLDLSPLVLLLFLYFAENVVGMMIFKAIPID